MLPPSIYLINAASIAKPHAMQQLRAEISSLKPEVVVVTESWLTGNHTNELFDMPDYVLFRQDRAQRRVNGRLRHGGGVAIWVQKQYATRIFIPTMDTDRSIELLWIQFIKDSRPCYVAGLYHPPDHPYHEARLLEVLEQSLDEIAQIHSDASDS